jgi:hypothetical protein
VRHASSKGRVFRECEAESGRLLGGNERKRMRILMEGLEEGLALEFL